MFFKRIVYLLDVEKIKCSFYTGTATCSALK